MLKVQNYLLQFENPEDGLKSLEDNFAIKATKNDTDGRVILNYNMIESPKTNEIVRECRGLVLDKDNGWKLVAKAFTRFFNHCEGEHLDFDWSNISASHKEDGSLIIYYFYNGEWRVNTKGSFGHGEVNDSGLTWKQLFSVATEPYSYEMSSLNKSYTYVFELCSIYNKVVRYYPEPTIFLLAIFDGENEVEINNQTIDLPTPITFKLNSIDEAISYIKAEEIKEKTYEGLVLKDRFEHRIKVKSESYLLLHRSANNGNISWEDIYKSCLTDDSGEEFLSYFNEYRPKFEIMKAFIKESKEYIEKTYSQVKDIENQKEFALAVKDIKFSSLFFALRKGDGSIDELFLTRSSYIVKLFEEHYKPIREANLLQEFSCINPS